LRRLRAGVIGCGPIARRGHLPALTSSSMVELVAVADLDPKALEKAAREFRVPNTFSDYRPMLEEKLDLVDICVPNHLHAKVAIDAINHGANVLVEKPLAISADEAERVVRTAQAQNVMICEAKQWRYVPALRKSHESFTKGKMGKLVSILAQWHSEIPLTWSHAQWYYDPAKSGGGIVSDIGIHLVDLLLLYGGPVGRVSASGGDYLGTMGFDTSVQALLEFSKGGSGLLDVSWLAPHSKFLQIVGTSGIAEVDMHYYSRTHWNYARSPFSDLKEAIGTIGRTSRRVMNKDFFNPLPRLFQALINDYAEAIINHLPSPIPGEMSVRALRVKEAIYKSLSEKRTVNL